MEKIIEEGKVVIETSTRNLKHYFAEDEKQKIGADLARSTQKKMSLEDDKKAVVDQYKSKISSAEFDIKEFAKMLNQGYEFRDIECEIIRDFVEKKISFRRLDIDEIVDTRAMLPYELQMELDFQSEKKEEKTVETPEKEKSKSKGKEKKE